MVIRFMLQNSRGNYVFSWEMPFTLTLPVYEAYTKASECFGEGAYIEMRDSYLSWVSGYLKKDSFWNDYNIPATGVSRDGKPIYCGNETWSEKGEINTEVTYKMLYGLTIWEGDTAISPKVFNSPIGRKSLGKWVIPEIVNQKGLNISTSGNSPLSRVYLAGCLKQLGKEQNVLEIISDILSEQITSKTQIANGAWRNQNFVDIEGSCVLIGHLLKAKKETP